MNYFREYRGFRVVGYVSNTRDLLPNEGPTYFRCQAAVSLAQEISTPAGIMSLQCGGGNLYVNLIITHSEHGLVISPLSFP